jgi:DNA-binding LytR/AlgR family response regulator
MNTPCLPYFTRPKQQPTTSDVGLWLPFQKTRKWVSWAQIVRLEGVGNYTTCYFLDGSQLLTALSLNVFADRLPDEATLRTHRKHLVNRLHVVAVSFALSDVLLSNGERIPIARRRIPTFRTTRLRPN